MSGLGKRELGARVLSATGAAAAWRRLGPARGQISILAYHRIHDIGDEDRFPFDPELVSATPAEFRWQMELVHSTFTPITFGRLADALDGQADLPARPILVSFDDGHRDNATHALPILQSLGISATFFLSTGYMGCPGTFWFDRVAQLLYRAPAGPVRVAPVGFEAVLDSVSSRRAAAGTLLKALKTVPDAVRRSALEEMERGLGEAPPATDGALSGSLSWDEVRGLLAGGMELGSHTVSHPILTRLGDSELDREMEDSRRAIETRTGQTVTTVAYPVGGHDAFDGRVVGAAVRAGYRLGVSYVSGVNSRQVPDRYALKRLHVERYTSRAWFESMLALPRLFA